MLTDNDFYIVMKLVSGENVMAILREEDDSNVLIEYPMVMRSIMDFEEGKEHLAASPFCVFTSDNDFVISKSNIMFIKKLNQTFIPHYRRIVSEYDASSFVLNSNKEEIITPERARSMIKQLKEVFSLEETEKEKELKQKISIMLPGNDTIN